MIGKGLLLVDTNIISHALSPNQTDAYALLFAELEEYYRFVVSGFTQFELLCSSSAINQERIIEYISSDMHYIVLSESLMNYAGVLHNLYQKHPSTKGHKIGHGDIINAAFSIIQKSPLVTMDSMDYPTPFFQEIDRKRITYTKSNNQKEITDTIYILQPDIQNIESCIERFIT